MRLFRLRRYPCALVLALLLTGLAGRSAAQTPSKTAARETGKIPWPGSEAGEASAEREAEEGERDEIETDRDSFTPATTTAGHGRLIFESAHSFLDNRGVKETHSFPEAIFRYGLTDWLELRVGANYEVGGAASEIAGAGGESDFDAQGRGSKLERESVIFYGIKVRASKQKGWIPQSAVIVQARTPTSGEAADTHLIGTYVFGWELPNRWKLDAALRYGSASEKEDRFSVWAPSVVVKVPVCEKVNVHAEYFGLFSHDKAEDFTRHFISPGVHYLITENLEVGVRVGWGLNHQSARFFSNVGVGLRF